MKHLHHSSLLQPQEFACGDRRDSCKAPPVAVQAAFAKKVPLPMDCDHGFLALLRNHGDLAFTLPDVKNRVRRITLSEHDSSLRYFDIDLPPSTLERKVSRSKALSFEVMPSSTSLPIMFRHRRRVGNVDYRQRHFFWRVTGKFSGDERQSASGPAGSIRRTLAGDPFRSAPRSVVDRGQPGPVFSNPRNAFHDFCL